MEGKKEAEGGDRDIKTPVEEAEFGCEYCGAQFRSINAYHIATAYGWFCSNECIAKFARKNRMTMFQVHYGK